MKSAGPSSHLHDFGCFLAELADDADGNFLAFLYREGVAGVAVEAGEGFVVDLDFQGLFGGFFGSGFGEVAQAFFPVVELVLRAAAEEAARRVAEPFFRRPKSTSASQIAQITAWRSPRALQRSRAD
jgi:hypothetical protein